VDDVLGPLLRPSRAAAGQKWREPDYDADERMQNL